MTTDFSGKVERFLSPTLQQLGFALEQVDDGDDEGGRRISVAYYRGADCKIQVYDSSREGEINYMIGPLSAPNEFGLRSPTKQWQFFTRFMKQPQLPIYELIQRAREEHAQYDEPLQWIADRIRQDYPAAHTGFLAAHLPAPD